MLSSLRTGIGNYILRRELAGVTRTRSMVNLAGAKTVGILYPLYTLPDYYEVETFVTSLQKDHKEVKALGFLQHKELTVRFLPKLSYDFFSRQELNWYYRPNHSRVMDFIQTEFDLLLDLTIREELPLTFVAALSRARCKVGPFSDERTNCYDLMIKVDPLQRVPEFIAQIRHYLTVINQPG